MNEATFELLIRFLQSGIFTLLGVLFTLFFTRKKSQAETEKARAEIKKLEEEAEKLNIENQNMRAEQMNVVMKQNNELNKAKEELKAKLHIANEENLLLSKELHTQRIESFEKQKKIEELSERQRKIEESLAIQHKDIAEMKKQTGQLPAQLPDTLEHKK
jgi:chromosome segregation ATPase